VVAQPVQPTLKLVRCSLDLNEQSSIWSQYALLVKSSTNGRERVYGAEFITLKTEGFQSPSGGKPCEKKKISGFFHGYLMKNLPSH
jgi:hypothetical protein